MTQMIVKVAVFWYVTVCCLV